ncbi:MULTISPECIES: YscW family type III secretion system pilotin [Vibrio]|uniref:Type III secretion system chaperone YscW n=1 Tax=Vibrio lentus TaxID=136468 RepID=A0A1B9QGJ4_9VIBR|nr:MULTISPECIES: YscW family type III secretion system pilotin [Vibrio]OCH62659.1 type III secretion system chaperone YscW [Vibrio lentus]PME55831.1 type III secretion system chaperone YscW [Vibrio lentus]PME64517.1 type III secretion system chaperone YscW [Vibrio lentus]PME95631.1 type III secretion system chaperone YscW [Vibrio lentus]PMG68525.1 type III secretion system chaperone YscW [Vibrio lentus]
MKANTCVLLLSIFLLSACTHTGHLGSMFKSDSQAALYGWVSFDEYVAPVNTLIDIDVCQVIEEKCISVARQTYHGVQLPVQYSFVIAPIQAGEGKMKIRAVLHSQGEIRAIKEEGYMFARGRFHQNLKLKAYNNE